LKSDHVLNPLFSHHRFDADKPARGYFISITSGGASRHLASRHHAKPSHSSHSRRPSQGHDASGSRTNTSRARASHCRTSNVFGRPKHIAFSAGGSPRWPLLRYRHSESWLRARPPRRCGRHGCGHSRDDYQLAHVLLPKITVSADQTEIP
jgi:hypothetical protein